MASEIFANYLSLSICNPRLVEMMGRYSPELFGILDKYKKGILGGGEAE